MDFKEEDSKKVEQPVIQDPSLSLDLDDKTLINVLDKRIKESESFYEKNLKLKDRQKLNREFYLGKQLDELNVDEWEKPVYIDNVIWRDEETRISIASGRMPDIISVPPDPSEEGKKMAKTHERALDITVNSDQTARLIKSGLRQHDVFLIAASKCRWDENLGENGDFLFELVDPKKIGFDHTAKIPHDGFTADNMDFIYEWIEEPLDVIVTKFPDAKDDLFKELGISTGTPMQMMAKVRYLEVWFSWYDKGEKIEGVLHKYNKLLLDKMKNPYWDWEGFQKAGLDDMGQPIVQDVYNNFFPFARKPYIFFSYQNLGESPIDDTNAIEQSIPLQRIINKRGRQITQISDRAIPKMAFAGNYITKESAAQFTHDPNQSIWLEGVEDIRQAITTIPATPPNPILYQDKEEARSEIDSFFSTHSVTRGELTPGESGISKQITREGDLTISDDIVNIVIERVVYEMANWATQMMKLNYDKPHHIRHMGPDGEFEYLQLTRDSIADGLAVEVKANSTDKAMRRNLATTLSESGNIDPLSLHEDLDVPNPKERTRRLITYKLGEVDGYARYAAEIGIDVSGGQGGGDQQALQDIQTLISGGQVNPPQQITEQYVMAFVNFVKGQDFASLQPQVQQIIQSYVQQLKASISQQAGGQQAPAEQPMALEQTPPVL
jgi:hypothetical protein